MSETDVNIAPNEALVTWLLEKMFCVTAGLLILLVVSLALPAQANLSLDGNTMPQTGHLQLRSDPHSAAVTELAQRSDLHIDVTANIATVTLTQTFVHQGDNWVEGEYVFPLPANAIVKQMTLQVGERRIVGRIREKQTAQALYQQARAQGRKASLVQQHRPNLFRTQIANIGPREKLSVTLVYRQLAQFDQGAFSLRFPMTITPRYHPDAAPDPVPMPLPITPSPARLHNPVHISGRVQAGVTLQTLYGVHHPLALTRSGSAYRFSLRAGEVEMERDFELVWKPVADAQPRATLLTETAADEHFALLMLLPPQTDQQQVLSREVVFVMDVSGSMAGASIRQARAALAKGLDSLHPEDRFNIIAFNNRAYALFDAPQQASQRHRAQALRFVQQLDAGGGTEMAGALELALAQPKVTESSLQQLIFITDGAVSNEESLFEFIASDLGARRLFTVGIGSAPNSWFMRKAAQLGRGRFVFIGDLEQVSSTMSKLLQDISRPLSRDTQLNWPEGVDVEQYPARIPDLYAGQPVLAVAKLQQPMKDGDLVTVSGLLAGQSWDYDISVSRDSEGQGLGDLWARARIDDLLDQKRRGQKDEASVRAGVTALSLSHQLLSPYTAFIALADQPERPLEAVQGRAEVRNTRPQGQQAAWPATATSAEAKLWLGMAALLLALLMHVLRREDEPCEPR